MGREREIDIYGGREEGGGKERKRDGWREGVRKRYR